MIKFKSVTWKNFLSTGNTSTTIDLNRTSTTLIVGQNGAGKSTLLDALSFALFGKPHRDIKKDQLINSINGKQCEATVSFDVGVHKFKIIRGIKPGKFEIYQNDKLINQSSTSRDYQKFLEQNILKLNHKSFHQIVVLGSSSFIPFMQLPAAHRRAVIEDLLDINIFTKMNGILKEKNGKLRQQIVDNDYNLDLIKEKIILQKKYIRDITEINDDLIRDKDSEISKVETQIDQLSKECETLSKSIEKDNNGLTENMKQAHNEKQSLLHYTAQFQTQISTIVKDAKFYEDNTECPVCTQSIDETIRSSKLRTAKDKAKELKDALSKASNRSQIIEDRIDDLNILTQSVRDNTATLTSNNRAMQLYRTQITDLNAGIASLQSKDTGDIGEANSSLEKHLTSRDTYGENKLRLLDERSYNDAASEMLKDTGIKTKVVKEYLPVMNNLVNKYLQVLDFFVAFNLDENFNETIRSRHRDAFNYASFSEGEKQRIDLALLFTWRQIAKMKNSTSTNLLILDETFDSSLDHDGVDNLMKILYTLEDDTNVFVISHKGDILDGKFKSKIEFVKERNFSKIK